MDPINANAIHHSQIQTATAADGSPILTTGPMTPSLDFNPSEFKRPDTAMGANEHSNPHPVVAKSGIDLSTGVARPAETHANSGTFTDSKTSAEPTVTGLRQRAGSISNTVGAKVNSVGNTVGAQLNSVGNTVGTQINHAAEHPAVQNAKQGAVQQVNTFRERLGRYPIIVDAEKRTGVDRVALVAGGVLAYLLLIPFNLFGLALPTTQLLTFLPPTFLALRTLDNPNEERTKTLLSYFVVFGFVQFAESLMAGFLERKIPQYYTVKLLFLAYLIHPRTKARCAKDPRPGSQTSLGPSPASPETLRPNHLAKHPPSTKPSSGPTVNSPTFPSQSMSGADAPLTRTSGFSGTGPSSTGHAGAPASVGSVDASGFPNAGTQTQGFNVGSGQIHLPSGGGNGIGQEVPKY